LWLPSVQSDAAIRDPAVLGDNTLTVADAIDETGLAGSLHVFGQRGRCGILLGGDFVDVGGSRQTTRVGGLTTPIGCRVGPGGCPPRPPTDPDVQVSRIRLFRSTGSLAGGRWSGRSSVAAAGSV
jgi:hypothetical protein